MSVGAQRLREDHDRVRQGAIDKGEDPSVVDRAIELDVRRRELANEGDRLKAERNLASKRIGEAIRGGAQPGGGEVAELRAASTELGGRIDAIDAELAAVEGELDETLLRIPNPADPDVPVGGEEANVTIREWGEQLPREQPAEGEVGADAEPGARTWTRRPHWELIPDKEDQMYVVTRDDLYLVPTAEVPVTNLHRDEILDAAELPIRYAAYSPCFRREAGAAGKDTRGILRVHQFDKVEMVLFEKPTESDAALEWMTARAEILLQRLGLAHRVLLMATREMGFVQAKKYDLEVWAPGVERWLEVSSCSNFRDYQARRMAIRYRPEPGAKPELVHTLNGSGLALARTVAALLETYQQPDGSIEVPDVLEPYLGVDRIAAVPQASAR